MRIYTSTDEALDYCNECGITEDEAIEQWGNIGDGSNGRGNCFEYDGTHPDYDDCEYYCQCCGERLTSKDN